jgi:heme-degrading monooxygenase HmoA
MLKAVTVHIGGPKMTDYQQMNVEAKFGSMAQFQSLLTQRTEQQLEALNTLLKEGWTKFDSQLAEFADGIAITYILQKPDPVTYVVESRWLTTDEQTEWELTAEPHTFTDVQSAIERQFHLSAISRDYQFRIREVSNV